MLPALFEHRHLSLVGGSFNDAKMTSLVQVVVGHSPTLKLPINILPDGFNIYDDHCLYPLFISLCVLKQWFPRSVIPHPF